jgi:ABC-2 type transport system permease protein
MLAIYKRELKSYFYSPIAYVIIGLFFVFTSILFMLSNLYATNADMSGVIGTMGFLLIFFVPIITMRSIAEDRKNGTEVLLATSPVTLTSRVIGKFLAAFTVFMSITVLTMIYPLILSAYGKLSFGILFGQYLGFILMGFAFIAVGIFASSLTENQIIAAVIGVVMLFIVWLLDAVSTSIGGFIGKVMQWISLMTRYQDFNYGDLKLSNVVYLISVAVIFIFLTIRIIDRKTMTQG